MEGDGVGSRERCRLVGREPDDPYDDDKALIDDALGSKFRRFAGIGMLFDPCEPEYAKA